MPKVSQERHQVKSLLFWLLCDLSIYHFRWYSMLFLPLYLSFYLDSLHRYPDSPHFSYFHPDSPHSHADSPHPHSHPIPRIPTLILRKSPHFILKFPILAFTNTLLSLYQSSQIMPQNCKTQDFFVKRNIYTSLES